MLLLIWLLLFAGGGVGLIVAETREGVGAEVGTAGGGGAGASEDAAGVVEVAVGAASGGAEGVGGVDTAGRVVAIAVAAAGVAIGGVGAVDVSVAAGDGHGVVVA